MKRVQIAFYSIIIAAALFVCVQSFSLGVWAKTGPGAGFMPLLIGVLLLGSVVGILAETNFFASIDPKEAFWAVPGSWKPTLIVLAGTVAMAILFEKAGYLLTVIPTLFIISFFIERASLAKMLTVPAIAIIFYYLFGSLLGVKLPKGPMGF
jgi:hypothetical protein